MSPLPIDSSLPAILAALRARRSLVLVAPPGAGKTTRVPPAVLTAGLLAAVHPHLILLQPRRVATRAVAARIAQEQGWTLGREVGYQVRFERLMSARTALRIQTEGILTRQLLADPFLETVGAVVLDEFHERSLHSDLALALLNEVRREVRPDLIVIVMSATLDAQPVARFLEDCPVIQVQGRAYPVEIEYAPAARPASPEAVASVVRGVLESPRRSGHVLVFLPGMSEIRRARAALEPIARPHGAEVLPLHGALAAEDQDRALRPSDRPRVILATNIAETSLTIEGVSAVIDSGMVRRAHYDPQRGFDRLELGRVSQASAAQRAGRAGRTAPGRCIRLWSEGQQRQLDPHEAPEVHRVDLCAAVLTLHSWGLADARGFSWYDPPSAERLEAGERLLEMLGALAPETRTITPLGRRMLDLPVHPRLARLLIAAADQGRIREGAALAALLSEKDILARPGADGLPPDRSTSLIERGRCDLLPRLDALEEAEEARFAPGLRGRGVDPLAARQAARLRDELVRLASGLQERGGKRAAEQDEDSVRKWLLLAYPDRLVKRRGAEETGLMVGGRGVRLGRESIVREGELFLALDPREGRRQGALELQVRLASAVERAWLEELLPHLLRRESATSYDEARDRVVERDRIWYLDLLLREDASRAAGPAEASAALAAALAPRAEALFREDEAAAAWLARHDLISRAIPELGWPEFSPAVFAELLPMLCQGRSRLEEVRKLDKISYLASCLSATQRRELEQGAPVSLQVPSGRQIRLRYEPGQPPVLAVRLQELFGWTETPRLARGRVPVVLHLLGPNHRPVQVTSDLRSFWTTTYHQVRKDLRARYPRHSWPEDPLTAQPAAGPKRRSP